MRHERAAKPEAYRAAGRRSEAKRYAPRSFVAFIECRFCKELCCVRSSRATRCRKPECRLAFNAERMRTKYRQHTKANKAMRRALEQAEAVKIIATEIYERDGWLCGICQHEVNSQLIYPDPMSASLDHVIPVSKGGNHTPDNVRCAHLTCNVKRGNRAA